MSGALCFRGTRIPVSTLFDHLRANQLSAFYSDFPDVTAEMVDAVLSSYERFVQRTELQTIA